LPLQPLLLDLPVFDLLPPSIHEPLARKASVEGALFEDLGLRLYCASLKDRRDVSYAFSCRSKANEQNNRPDRRRGGDYPKGAQPLSFKTLECRQGWANGGAVSLGIDDAIARFQIDPRDRESGLFGILDGFLMHAASIWHLLR
jgi:hypothetical protein